MSKYPDGLQEIYDLFSEFIEKMNTLLDQIIAEQECISNRMEDLMESFTEKINAADLADEALADKEEAQAQEAAPDTAPIGTTGLPEPELDIF